MLIVYPQHKLRWSSFGCVLTRVLISVLDVPGASPRGLLRNTCFFLCHIGFLSITGLLWTLIQSAESSEDREIYYLTLAINNDARGPLAQRESGGKTATPSKRAELLYHLKNQPCFMNVTSENLMAKSTAFIHKDAVAKVFQGVARVFAWDLHRQSLDLMFCLCLPWAHLRRVFTSSDGPRVTSVKATALNEAHDECHVFPRMPKYILMQPKYMGIYWKI